MSPVNTVYYEKLGVEPTCTQAELKAAYRKTALRLHPDKGGDPEEFKAMKAAYDVLSDPQKRQLYDDWGPEAVQMREGKIVTPDVIAKMLSRVSNKARCMAVIAILSVSLAILSPAILISLKWNDQVAWPWMVVFVPLWVAEVAIIFCMCCVMDVTPPEDEASMEEEDRARFAQQKNEVRVIRCIGTIVISCFILFELFVGMKLEGDIKVSWFFVVLPWVLFEFISLVRRMSNMSQSFADAEPEAAATAAAVGGRPVGIWPFFIRSILWSVMRLASMLLLAAKADGQLKNSWYFCVSPLFAGALIDMALVYYKQKTRPPRPAPAEGEEEEKDEETVIGTCCGASCWLFMVCMAAGKLDGGSYSAFYIFLPIFLVVGLITCFFSCLAVRLNEEDVTRGMEQQNLNPNAGRADYGTTSAQGSQEAGAAPEPTAAGPSGV